VAAVDTVLRFGVAAVHRDRLLSILNLCLVQAGLSGREAPRESGPESCDQSARGEARTRLDLHSAELSLALCHNEHRSRGAPIRVQSRVRRELLTDLAVSSRSSSARRPAFTSPHLTASTRSLSTTRRPAAQDDESEHNTSVVSTATPLELTRDPAPADLESEEIRGSGRKVETKDLGCPDPRTEG
jgi:hypothetical protein